MTRRQFAQCWQANGGKAMAECYDAAGGNIQIDSVMHALRVKVKLFLPAVLEVVVPVVLIGALILGLNFRNAYPDYSAMAIGISSMTLVATLLQWSFSPLLLAAKLGELERESGKPIRAVDELPGAGGKKRRPSAAR
jgi:hypothetical protein